MIEIFWLLNIVYFLSSSPPSLPPTSQLAETCRGGPYHIDLVEDRSQDCRSHVIYSLTETRPYKTKAINSPRFIPD